MSTPTVTSPPAPRPHPARAQPRRRKTLAFVGGLALIAGVLVLPPYLGLNASQSKVDVANLAPWHYAALLLHIGPAVIALVVGPLQFSAKIRRKARIHRVTGRVFAISVVLSSIAGAVIGVLSTAGPTAWFGFVMLDGLWLTTTVLGWRAARNHRYADHGAWMIRSYALTFAGVTLRVWLVALIIAFQPLRNNYFHGDNSLLIAQAYLVTSWLSWVPNLIVGEMLVARLRRTQGRTSEDRRSAIGRD